MGQRRGILPLQHLICVLLILYVLNIKPARSELRGPVERGAARECCLGDTGQEA